jgi:hypothetical protein
MRHNMKILQWPTSELTSNKRVKRSVCVCVCVCVHQCICITETDIFSVVVAN